MSRVIIFLLEGKSDKQALEYPMSMFLDEINSTLVPQFFYPPDDKGDITNDPSVSQKEIIKKIPSWWNIEEELNKRGLKISDVIEIIQIIDIDGVYIDDNSIIYSPIKKIQYYEDRIVCPNRDRIIQRNLHKRHSITKLKSIHSLTISNQNIPYSIYYFCCNMDHFTCGDRNLVIDEKCSKATDFAYGFHCGNEFLDFFLSENNVCCSTTDYKDSWELLKMNNNSLTCCSNLHLLLSNLKEKYVEGDETI